MKYERAYEYKDTSYVICVYKDGDKILARCIFKAAIRSITLPILPEETVAGISSIIKLANEAIDKSQGLPEDVFKALKKLGFTAHD